MSTEPTGRRRTRAATAPRPEDRSIETRLARVHLRTGMIGLARAELETLVAQGALDTTALADLAEARWRSGDLSGAGEAAAAHLDEGGRERIALAVAAEALAARGRTAEARTHAKRLLAAIADPAAGDTLDSLFAGQPRGAIWPETADETVVGVGPEAEIQPEAEAEAEAPVPEPGPAGVPLWATPEAGEETPPTDAGEQTVGLAEEMALGPAGVAAGSAPRPATGDEIALIEADIVAGELRDVAVRLSIILREEGSLAPLVLSLADRALAVDAPPRIAAALQLVRGDAFRALGREIEAADAFARSRRAVARRAVARQALERAITDEGDR
ncbi:MAG: hypothetical protein ACHQ15_02115 [Candidatus Limnocylindrales bacterium]